MIDFFNIARPILHALDAELAHSLTVKSLKYGLHPCITTPDDTRLAQTVYGLQFKNPIGMAAGFDKNAEALNALFALGFGFVEAGTVTPRAQIGNPKPRIFREPKSQSVINRMGFPGAGADVFLKNLARFKKTAPRILGINIGKNKDTEDAAADYIALITRMAPKADYLTINISSPNTPGLRDLQKQEFLTPFIKALKEARAKACKGTTEPPLLIKLAPDLSDAQVTELSQTLQDSRIDGIIISNTTLARPEILPEDFRKQAGGLSGPHVREKSTFVIHRFYAETKGKIPIIGVGGISNATDAYTKIRAGASLIQIYTALIFKGPALITDIKTGIIKHLDRDGFKSITDAIGADHK